MHDNTWARALKAYGAQVTLIPTYTPIRLDEEDQSTHRVFLGGVNVFMEFKWPWLWRKLPRAFTRPLDARWLLNLTRFVSSDARQLGPLTLAMLEGEAGPERREIDELVEFLCRQLKPDVICFSNVLLVGTVRRLREKFDGQIYCVLQGDDIFLNDLPERYRRRAVETIGRRAVDFDGFLVHSHYYRDFMSDYLQLPIEKFHQLPLGIDLQGHDGQPDAEKNALFTVGYFARICEEKGLLQLVEAFHILHAKHPNTRLLTGGYLGKRDARYFRRVLESARTLGPDFEHVGIPQKHAEKVALLKQFDVLSVPTVYREPKGLYVLEALANGVPVVQPRHGAFSELIEATGGGLLVNPGDANDLARALEELMLNPRRRMELAAAGQANVRAWFDERTLAETTIRIFERNRRCT